MIITFGTRLYGAIERHQGTHVATRFFHVFFLPLVPLETQIVLGTGATPGSYSFIPARLSGRSIAAAYLRTWGTLVGLFLCLGAVAAFADALTAHAWRDLVLAPLVVFLTTAAVASSFYSLGRLSDAAREQLEAYARFVGAPVDVARLDARQIEVRAAAIELLRERSLALGLLGYRGEDGGAAGPDFLALALSPAARDPELLDGALTLARIEMSSATGAARRDLARRHAAIAARLHELRAAAPSTSSPSVAA